MVSKLASLRSPYVETLIGVKYAEESMARITLYDAEGSHCGYNIIMSVMFWGK